MVFKNDLGSLARQMFLAIDKEFGKVNREGMGFLETNMSRCKAAISEILSKAPVCVGIIVEGPQSLLGKRILGFVNDGYLISGDDKFGPTEWVADDSVRHNGATYNVNRDRNYGVRVGDIVSESHNGHLSRRGVVVSGMLGDNNRVRIFNLDTKEMVNVVAEWQDIEERVEDRLAKALGAANA